jgi:hypothetical protein
MALPQQPVAIDGNGFRVFQPFSRRSICHRLPPVATVRLHECSILARENRWLSHERAFSRLGEDHAFA